LKPRTFLKVLPLAVASFALGGTASAATFLEAQPGNGTLPTRVSAAALQDAAVGQKADLLIAGKRYVLVVDKSVTALDGRHLDGHIEGSPGNRIALRVRPGGLAAGILDLPGRPLRLGYANDGQWLLDVPADEIRAAKADFGPQIFVARESAAEIPTHATAKAVSADKSGQDDKPADVSYPVSLNLADLSGLQSGAQAQLSLPNSDLKVTYEQTRLSDTGAATWIGHLTDYGKDYRVVLTYSPSGTTGSITTPDGEILVSGAGNKTWLVDTAASGIKHNPNAKDDCAVAPPANAAGATAAGGASAGATASSGSTTTAPKTAAAGTAATTVDVLVLYSSGLVTRYGGDAQANTRIDYLLALANQAYVDSGVSLTLRKVGTKALSIADTTSNSTTLSQLAAGSGDFSTIPALRNQLGADAVLLVRPFYMTAQGGNCGVGYIGGYGGSNIAGYASYAFAVVSDGKDVTGQSYYCTDYTFTHELGHNMGLMHDRPTVTQQGGGMGAFPYAYGYGQQGRFGTIMSYNYPVVGRFSNPLDLSCAAGPCGVAETDTANSAYNAKALSLTKDAFSAFRTGTVADKVSVSGVVTVNGQAAANLNVLASGTTCGVTGSNGAYACTFSKGWTGTVSVSAPNVTFSPTQQSFSNLQASASQNFTGVSAKVTIGGVVTIDGSAASGLAVSAGGATCGTTTASGSYSCSVAKGWTGTVSVSKAHVAFSPVTKSFSNVQAAATQNFVGTSIKVKVSGKVTVDGKARSGASILANGTACATTSSTGAYACTFTEGWSGTMSVGGISNVLFTPTSQSYSSLAAAASLNFSGKTQATNVTVSGTAKVNGVATGGVVIKANGSTCATSASNGAFSCNVASGFSGQLTATYPSATFGVMAATNLKQSVSVTFYGYH
jgi:hypothetical protein